MEFCKTAGITLIPVAADAHEANGTIERANRSLRSHFNRLRLNDQRASTVELVQEAAYARNINRGNNLASPFELLYHRTPSLHGKDETPQKPIASIKENNAHITRRRVAALLRSNIRDPPKVSIGDVVHFWRDNDGWLGPAEVITVTDYGVEISHNGIMKTSSHNRIRHLGDTTNASAKPNTARPASPSIYASSSDSEEDTSPPNEELTARPRNRIPAFELRNVILDGQTHGIDSEPQDNPQRPLTRSQANLLTEHVDHSEKERPDLGISYLQMSEEEERTKAYQREKLNWQSQNAYELVARSSVPSGANIIGSHTIYLRKDDGTLKARIVPWGHRDSEKDNIRSDSPCLNLEIFRIVLSLAAENGWVLGQMDVRAAFLQARGFFRTIYVRPPKEEKDSASLWKLLASAYGLVESGRLWYRTSDGALVDEYGLTRSRYEHTLYYRKEESGSLSFVLATQVDNYIYAGTQDEVSKFEKFLQKRFEIGTLDRHNFTVMGCEIGQTPAGTITLTQRARLEAIDGDILIPEEKQRAPDRPATPTEITAYRSVIGRMLYIGRTTHPVMLFHASHMATKVNQLRKHHLKDLHALLKFDKREEAKILYRAPSSAREFTLEAVSDASMSPITEGGGRGAYIIMRRQNDTIHPIYWSARKLRRVARSSSTAELLAASDAVSTLTYMQQLLGEITYRPRSSMFVDSRALLNLATTIREPIEVANKLDLASIRESFTPLVVSTFGWIPGYYNISDALTKDNRVTAALLNRTLREGTYPTHPESIRVEAEPPLTVTIETLNENELIAMQDENGRKGGM